MQGIKLLFVAALATTVSATYFNGELLRREIHLQARATATATATSSTTVTGPTVTVTAFANTTNSNSSNACSSVLQGLATLFTGLPTPSGDLFSYLATAATTLTDPCHLSVPTSIASTFSVYESSVISFYSAHITQLNSALAACPSLTSLVANPICSTSPGGLAVSTATATATAAASGTSAASSSTSKPPVVTNAGANQNPPAIGIVVISMVAAGLAGAMVLAL